MRNRISLHGLLLCGGLLGAPALAALSEDTLGVDPPASSACETEVARGLGEGPLVIGFYEADLATGRHACPRSELSLGGRGGAIIDTPNFYGAISGDALLSASYAL